VAKILAADPGQAPATVEDVERRQGRGVLAEAHVARLGRELFDRHAVAVQVAGALLLVALVGAAVIVARSKGPLVGPASRTMDRGGSPH
jgi:hypothetical protein